MEAVRTSETSVYSETTRRCIPEGSNIQTNHGPLITLQSHHFLKLLKSLSYLDTLYQLLSVASNEIKRQTWIVSEFGDIPRTNGTRSWNKERFDLTFHTLCLQTVTEIFSFSCVYRDDPDVTHDAWNGVLMHMPGRYLRSAMFIHKKSFLEPFKC
jgi:hypothetical protein